MALLLVISAIIICFSDSGTISSIVKFTNKALTQEKTAKENRLTRALLFKFVQSPNRNNYLTIRKIVIELDTYRPYSNELDTAGELYEQAKLKQAQETIGNAIHNLILSPRAHHFLSFLHYELGDVNAAELEMTIGQACIKGILSSGDGSEEHPYIVVRTSDEHDVIEHMGKQIKQQAIVPRGDKYLDLIECTDNSKYWFDITDAHNRLFSQ